MQQMEQDKEVLKNTYKTCLDILRTDGITGDKALRNMTYFFILKLIEPKLDTEIKIQECNYDLDDEQLEKHMALVRFSDIVKLKDDSLHASIECLNNNILAVHPSTCKLFKEGRLPDIVNQSTYRRLLNKLADLDLSQTEYDVLGNSYEEVIKDVMTGKVLGQFFTQPIVKNLMVKMIDPQLLPDGTMETCCDPTMGTGGFLISCMRHILKQARDNAIQPDWNFITTQGLYGKEISPDTFQLALSNMLISSGHLFDNLENGDSIRQPIDKKFDIVLANPPFGIKGLKYDEFTSTIRDKYIPIKTDNAVSLFLQAIIYMLKINGRCAVVLPNGKDLFSKDKGFVEVRKYLMKTCDLREIIHLPNDVFENTSVKTCIFYFVKKCDDAVKIENQVTKTGKVKGREYEFVSEHQTTSVKFYDYVPQTETKALLVDVPIDKIVSNSYSLNHAEYLEKVADVVNDGVVMKTLGEVCKVNQGTYITTNMKISGEFPVYGGGNVSSYINQFNRENEIIVAKDGVSAECVRYEKDKFFLNHHGWTIDCMDCIIKKYMYYYLSFIQPELLSIAKGTAQLGINQTNFYGIKIPIPPLEKQKEIVEYLDYIYEVANKTSRDKISQLKRLNELCLRSQKSFGVNEVKTLGEVCEIEYGKRITKKKDEGTEYPAYGGGDIMDYRVNNFNRDGVTYKISRDGLSRHNCVLKLYGKLFLNDTALTLNSKNDKYLNPNYLGEFLLNIKDEIYDTCTHGTGQLHIDLERFMNVKIPIPSLEKQKEIVDYCEANDKVIELLENEIKRNEDQAKETLNSIVNVRVKPVFEPLPEVVETNVVNEVKKEKIKLKIISKKTM
jgi:type I restriction enzyme M protein